MTTPTDDRFMDELGDCLTPNELRHLDLTDPELIARRDQYLAEYARTGIGDDQDPGSLELVIPAVEDEPAEQFAARALGAAQAAWQLQRATPDDFRETP